MKSCVASIWAPRMCSINVTIATVTTMKFLFLLPTQHTEELCVWKIREMQTLIKQDRA